MTNTDHEYGTDIGHELKYASSLFVAPGGLAHRVGELEGSRSRRRASVRAAALGLSAVATVGGVAWARQSREAEVPAAAAPPPVGLAASPTADRIDAYPVVEWPGDPIPGALAGYSSHDDDQGWGGAVGVVRPGMAPASIIGIHAFPIGWDTSFPGSHPGRIDGVTETTFDNGATTLTWNVDGVPMSVTGDDTELMYQLIDVVQPIDGTSPRDGYSFSGPLPGGLVEIETPYHRIPMRAPTVSTNDGRFGVSVHDGPLLTTLAGSGANTVEPISINGRDGFRSTEQPYVIALALSTDETLWISAEHLDLEQLTEIAEHVTITDEATWRAHYQLESTSNAPEVTTSTR